MRWDFFTEIASGFEDEHVLEGSRDLDQQALHGLTGVDGVSIGRTFRWRGWAKPESARF